MMNFNYGFVCTIASTVGSYFGTIVIQKLVKDTGRVSVLIFALSAVLGVSTIFIPGHTLAKLIEDINNRKSVVDFNSPC